MNELLAKYIEQIKADLDINMVNVAEVARKLPARRHFWGARLIEHKVRINELESQKKKILKAVSDKINTESVVGLTPKGVERAASQSEEINKLNEEIASNKLLVEFLEHVQKNFFSATYDVKNIIDIMKLEQL